MINKSSRRKELIDDKSRTGEMRNDIPIKGHMRNAKSRRGKEETIVQQTYT